MTKENMLDRYIHRHGPEIMPGRYLRHGSRINGRIDSRFLSGVLLGIAIMGLL